MHAWSSSISKISGSRPGRRTRPGRGASARTGAGVHGTRSSRCAICRRCGKFSVTSENCVMTMTEMISETVSHLTNEDLYLFNEGSHFRLYDKLGAHPTEVDGIAGTHFAVWAPNARSVSVIG